MKYWQKQTKDRPLFADILWSRPETRLGAGKLLIAGGNSHGFSSVGQAFRTGTATGIGTAHNLLPNSLKKTVGTILENTSYAPSTPSGSYGSEALAELLNHSSWSDATLLSGDFGRNSETAIMLEKFISTYKGKLVVTKDAIEYFYNQPNLLLDRENTLVVLNLSQLQKLAIASKFTTPIILSMGLVMLAQALHTFSLKHSAIIVTKEFSNVVVAHQGRVSTTKAALDEELWQVTAATKAAVFWIQNPDKAYESITSSLIA